jgi:DNA-binding transcriptional regulator YiaG
MHHFKDGGLENIWLANGYKLKKTPYGDGVSIRDLDGLVSAISLSLVKKPHKLNGREFRYLRQALLLSQGSVASLFGCTEQTVSLWERHGRVPLWADKLLRITYIGSVQENTTVKEMIARMNFVDRVINHKIILHESNKGWESSLEKLQEADA